MTDAICRDDVRRPRAARPFEYIDPSARRLPGTRARVGHLPWILALCCIASAGWAVGPGEDEATPIRAGWVDSFDGPATGYGVLRAKDKHPVGYFMILYAGDRIEVYEPDGLIRIRLGEGRSIVINKPRSGYLVEAVGEPPNAWGNFMRWAGDWFTSLHVEPTPERPIIGASRGEAATEPASGLLRNERVGLAAGRRPLAVAWRGGQPPFEIELTPEGTAEPTVDQTGVTARHLSMPEVALTPGTYRLRIADAKDAELVTLLDVVASDVVPRPAATIPGDLPAEVQASVRAAWLASQGDGWYWRLEAYQHLADLSDYEPAAMLRRALIEEGTLPPPPFDE